jgi:starch synthase
MGREEGLREMDRKLKILLLASEISPLAKSGGLADVTAALAIHLKRRGHDVRVVLPFYRCTHERVHQVNVELASMCVRMAEGEEWCGVLHAHLDGGVPVYLIEHDRFFDRDGLYHDERMQDYGDNPRRFGFFARAALQLCMDIGFAPDIVHSNDWQTALVSAYLKVWFWNQGELGRAASVLTLHNLAYQGVYPASHYGYLGLGLDNFQPAIFEDYGRVNFLKGGIHFADVVNTVSPTYACECLEPGGGFGLAPYLTDKGDRFRGILNGADYQVWTPEHDPMISAHFNAEDLAGKAICKREMQRAFLLEEKPEICVIALIGRLVEQKGFQLVSEAIHAILRDMEVQFVILGTGDQHLSHHFGTLPARYPGRVGSFIGFNDELAHRIEAGADFLVMPSLFEPCGLNQIYSLRYGTLPIVRATGGLDDTVDQYDERTGDGTGFKFLQPTPRAVYDTVGWAVSTWYDRPAHIDRMRRRAMRKDFSWERSILDYEDLYNQALSVKFNYDHRNRV